MTRDSTALVRRLQDALDGSGSGTTKAWWDRRLEGAIEFRGVGIPRIRSVLDAWRSDGGVASWPTVDQFALALRLFEEPLAEDKLAGILFLQQYLIDGVPWGEALTRYGSLFERRRITDWNTCDWFCVRVLGPTIATHGRECAETVSRWSRSPEPWKARASVVGFVPFFAEIDYHPLGLRSSAVWIRRDERFVKTGVGWVLRELSRRDPDTVSAFVDEHSFHFSTESLRNALQSLPEAARRKGFEDRKTARRRQAADDAARRR